jgi:hypothetical protein
MPDHPHPEPRPPEPTPAGARPPEPQRTWLLTGVRYVLPGLIVLAGVIVMSLGGETDLEGGAGIVGAGLAVFFLNLLFRAGLSGDREREAEDAAREYFDRHGRWPG